MEYALLFVLALLLGWLLLRRRRARLEAESGRFRNKPQTGDTRFHAVSIRFDENACLAAKQLAGRRFLATEAPPIPLPACNADSCNCHFGHHDDRRSGKDRRSPFGSGGFAAGSGQYKTERRSGKDRRSNPPDNRA